MAISLCDAITSIKKDEKYVSKTITGGLAFLIPVIFIIISGLFFKDNFVVNVFSCLIMFVISIFVTGFIFLTGNKQLNSDSLNMTEWKDSGLFKIGFKTCIAYILYSIILMIFSLIAGLVLGLVFGLIFGLLKNINFASLQIFIFVLSNLTGIFIGLIVALFINTASSSFVINLKIGDMLALKKHFNIIRENQHACWTLIGKMILYSLLFIVLALLLSVFVVTAILLPFLYFAAYIVYINLLVQFGKEINIQRYFA